MKLVMLGKAAVCRVKRVILAIATLQQTAGVSGVAVLRVEIRVEDYGVERYRPGKKGNVQCGKEAKRLSK